MQKIICLLIISLFSTYSFGFEIFALGTSNTNCRAGGYAFTNKLNQMLLANGIQANVVNAGVDGDKPVFMVNRLEQGLKNYPEIKLILFEPGPNEQNKRFNMEYTEKILSQLQEMKMPTIYSSSGMAQSRDEAIITAKKYGAYYYGPWLRDVPKDRVHYTFDGVKSETGHMAAPGCELWAKNMLPLVLQVIKEHNIR